MCQLFKKGVMGFIYDTVAEYDAAIVTLREAMMTAAGGAKWRINTSQSDQQVSMDMKQTKEYLNMLAGEREALYQRSIGDSVTSITFRRCY